jgi:hypothetical protein
VLAIEGAIDGAVRYETGTRDLELSLQSGSGPIWIGSEEATGLRMVLLMLLMLNVGEGGAADWSPKRRVG